MQDVLYYAGGSRPGVKNLLNRKLEKAKAPVYNYVFAWEYPINGGITASIARSWRSASTR